MNYAVIRNLVGKMMMFVACLMVIPLIFVLAYGENYMNAIAFLIPLASLALIGFLFNIRKAKDSRIKAREGLVIVGSSWLIMSLFGSFPFIISGEIPDFFDAFFEITSGFSTTGASILSGSQIEALSHSMQFWRTFSHWIGGMGILVFILAIIPESKEGSAIHILRAESPGPQVGKLVSKMSATSKILYLIYIVLTVSEFLFLWIGPDKSMDFFSSIIYSLGTAGTGGFAISGNSIADYGVYSQYVIAVYMLIFGINFTMFYLLLIKNFKEVFKSEELRWYLSIIVISIIVLFLSIYLTQVSSSVEESFRMAFFHTTSFVSTTGFTNSVGFKAYDNWPMIAQVVLVVLMFFGSCAGSTSGGIKLSRIIILIKSSISRVGNMISPRKVKSVFVNGKQVDDETIDSVQSFTIVYLLVLLICTLLISIEGHDLLTNFTASLSCVSNVGPAFGLIGPSEVGSYAFFSPFSKFILSLEMIAGRLELFPILILFSPKTWKKYI